MQDNQDKELNMDEVQTEYTRIKKSRRKHGCLFLVSAVCCLCDGLITRLEKSYRLWCDTVCDLQTSRMRRPWPALGCCAREMGRSLMSSCLRKPFFKWQSHTQRQAYYWNTRLVHETWRAGEGGRILRHMRHRNRVSIGHIMFNLWDTTTGIRPTMLFRS